MKIEDGKTSSDIFAGCAPLEWIRDVAVDFANKIWGKFVDVAKAVGDFFSKMGRKLAEAGKSAIANIQSFLNVKILEKIMPFISAAAPVAGVTYGAIVLGIQILRSPNPCLKQFVRGAAVVGAVAGGLFGLKALAGSAGLLLLRTPLIGALIRALTRTVSYAYTWNWQITDKEIRQRQESILVGLSSQAGTAVGTTLGGLLCGGVAGAAIVKFNPRVAAKMWEVAGDDIKDEIVGSIQALAVGAGRAARQLAFLESYKNARTWIKKAAQFPAIKSLLPDSWEKVVETWGNEGNKPWSFALYVEEKIESIKDAKLRAFTEEAVESFMDSCTESLIAVSYAT